MAITAATQWRIRAGGAEANGGGYDPTISGAGTDYTDQDAAELTLTDLATSGAGSTTLTSVTGGFTSAMIGNCVRISAGTNFQTGYYFITARTNTNTVTLDRTPSSGGAGSGGSGKVGGAFATINSLSNGGGGAGPAVTTPLAAGHTIYIRGSGGEDPGSADFTYSTYYQLPQGDSTNGKVAIIGYNGRPRMDVGGLFLWQLGYVHIESLHIKATGASFAHLGFVGTPLHIIDIVDCWFDQAGYDVSGVNAHSIEGCKFFNTGSSSAGTATNPAIRAAGSSGGGYGASIYRNDINGWRGRGVIVTDSIPCIERNVVRNCKSDGIYFDTSSSTLFGTTFRNNSVYGNTADGIEVNNVNLPVQVNIEYNILDSNGGYGLNLSNGTQAANDRKIRTLARKNFFYGNTSGLRNGISAGSGDVTLTGSPFTDAAGGDFSLNNTTGAGAACRAVCDGAYPGGVGTSYLDAGAIQHQDSGGSGGGGRSGKTSLGSVVMI